MCNCGSNTTTSTDNAQYVVTLPSGQKKVVTGEHAAKVEVTMNGGGTYTKV